MKFLVSVTSKVIFIILINDASAVKKENRNQDSLSRSLFDYKERHEVADILTTSAGQPVDKNQISTLNTDLSLNPFFIDIIKNAVKERVPHRHVFAKGTGAHGYFEATKNMTKYTRAKLFEKVGKRTPVFVRFSTEDTDTDSSDTSLGAVRGLSVKFYTEEGNLDLLGLGIPVYFYRDPNRFWSFHRSVRINPKTQIRDVSQIIDFISLNPNSLQAFFWAISEYGIPKSYRHMNSFTDHAFEIYNSFGKSRFARIYFITEQGYDFLSIEEALAISSFDYDFFQRDLYNSIAANNFPCWKLHMDILKGKDPLSLDFDPFDVTRLWPNGTYKTVIVGRFCLNRNIENHFAEVEQVTMNPFNLVPGIGPPLDKMYQGRVMAYSDSQMNRVGNNHNEIKINCPLHAVTYNQDGEPPVSSYKNGTPNYLFNSFNGPEPYHDLVKKNKKLQPKEENTPDFEGCARFYNEVLKTDEQKQRFMNNLIINGIRVDFKVLADLFISLAPLFEKAPNFLIRLGETYARARATFSLPKCVSDMNNETCHPYDKFLSTKSILSPVVDKVTKVTKIAGSLL